VEVVVRMLRILWIRSQRQREDLVGPVSMDFIAGLQEVVAFRIPFKVKQTKLSASERG
jgi:hypothetical protein